MLHFYYELLTQWLYLHPQWSGVIIFVVTFSESVALVGSIVPGSVIMTAMGILIGSGVLPLWITLLWITSGAFIGDTLSYLLGYHFKERIRFVWPFTRYPAALIRGQSFLLKHGGKSVFIGRFMGPVRAIVPMIAGMFNMQPKRYVLVDILAVICWAPLYMLPGLLIGAASLEMPADIAAGLIVFILAILISIWLIVKAIQYLYQKTHHYLAEFFDKKWSYWETCPSRRWLCFLLRYAGRPGQRGQILSALMCCVAFILFVFLFISVMQTDLFVPLNDSIYHLFRGGRTPTLDKFMIVITSFGDRYVVLPFFLLLSSFFIIKRHYLTAIHYMGGSLTAIFLISFIRHFFFLPRPPGILSVLDTSSFPSGHVMLSVVIYGLLAFFIGKAIKTNIRQYVYWMCAGFCGLIGVSRLYLGVHWLTDIIGSVLLGLVCVSITIISYRRYYRDQFVLKSFLIVFCIALSLTMGWYLYRNYGTGTANYQLYWKSQIVDKSVWWQQSSSMFPLYRTNRLGKPVEVLNVQWAGSLQSVKKALEQNGWQHVRIRNYWMTLEGIIEQDVAKYRTILPVLYDDQPPVIEMIKKLKSKSLPLILRLWPAHIYLSPEQEQVWIGTIYYDNLSKRLLFIHHRTQALSDEESKVLMPILIGCTWHVKVIRKEELLESKEVIDDKIMLIKPKNLIIKGE